METAIRQGDVILVKVDMLPEKAKPVTSNVLREGEVTGHKHKVEGDVSVFSVGELLYVNVNGKAKIVHNTHRMIELPTGIYEVRVPQEYDYIEEEKRWVSD